MFASACLIDQYVLKEVFCQHKWYVHSKYENSFNLVTSEKKDLVVVTTTEYPLVPNGIYLEKNSFRQLLKGIENRQQVSWDEDSLSFSNHYLILTQAKLYSSEINLSGDLVEASWNFFSSYILNVVRETGKGISFSRLLATSDPYVKGIQQVCGIEVKEQKRGVRYLLGRGKGLTPTGDDMLVGHLAARILLKQESASFMTILRADLSLEKQLTTDVSKHYLLSALAQHFSGPVKQLLRVLTGASNQEQIIKATDAILEIGHTSGLDLLVGFWATIEYFKNQ